MADTAVLERTGQSTTVSRWSAWVAVLAVLAGLVVSPPWQGGAGIPAGSVGRLVSGQLERAVSGGGWTGVAVGELVPEGARVRTAEGAGIEVDGGDLSLAEGTRAVLDVTSELEVGSLLIEVPGMERAVRVGAVVASGRGAWRVDVGSADRVGVYQGGVGLRVSGDAEQALAVGRYEQADLVAGGLPGEAVPLRYEATDEWDARLLAGLLATDRQAAQLQATFAGRYGEEPLPASFYTDFTVVDGAIADALPRYGQTDGSRRVGPPGTVLLGVIATDMIATHEALAGTAAVLRVTELRGAGATWGIVLGLHGLGADDLREAADLALRGGPVGAPPEVGVPGPIEAPTGSNGGPDGSQPSEEPTGPSASPSPSPSESDAPGPCQLEPCEPLNESVDDITDVIDGVLPGTGETIDDLVSEVPTILPPGSLD